MLGSRRCLCCGENFDVVIGSEDSKTRWKCCRCSGIRSEDERENEQIEEERYMDELKKQIWQEEHRGMIRPCASARKAQSKIAADLAELGDKGDFDDFADMIAKKTQAELESVKRTNHKKEEEALSRLFSMGHTSSLGRNAHTGVKPVSTG